MKLLQNGTLAILAMGITGAPIFACGGYGMFPSGLVLRALSTETNKAEKAIRKLRFMGPEGFNEVHRAHFGFRYRVLRLERTIKRNKEMDLSNLTFQDRVNHAVTMDKLQKDLMIALDQQRKFNALLDFVANQKQASKSHMYWFTDLAKAKTYAGKHRRMKILSLRINGSLANPLPGSFAAELIDKIYSNPKISGFIRSRFILHWVTTTNLADGRGHHLILDPDGNPLVSISGTLDPDSFLQQLQETQKSLQTASVR